MPSDHDSKYEKEAYEALDNIKYCSKMAFFSVFVDVLIEILDRGVTHQWSWLDVANVLDAFSLAGFGLGLFQVSRTYKQALLNDTDLSAEALLVLFQTIGRVWLQGTINLFIGALAMAVDSGSRYVVAVFVLAVLGGVTLRKSAAALVAEPLHDGQQQPTVVEAKYGLSMNSVRQQGFLVVRNMMFCMGGFGLLGLTRFVTLMASNDSILEKIFGMSDVVEWMAIGGLVGTLSRSGARVVVDVTNVRNRQGDNHEVYRDLYEAEKGVYKRIGNVLFGASIFTLLPFLYNVATPLLGLN